VFFVTSVAEINRVPFDLPEAETELVSGFCTEYSSMKYALFFMAEYANMVVVAAVISTLFLGGPAGPFPGVINLLLKVFFFMFILIWMRATFPRVRYDQLMFMGWKVFLPLALLNIVITGAVIVL
jgi:NADH-quinone oxidoreductase subunit H